MSLDWTEKYRPSSLDMVIGNPKAVSELRAWAKEWSSGTPSKRAVVLMGTPGIGKTSAAVALASDMGWGLVEMNSSDQRTGDAISAVALKGAYGNTFTDSGNYLDSKEGGKKLIILDEADSLFGREDRGALPVIAELIKRTKQPVILIVNDFYALSRKSSAVKTDTLQITFFKPRSTEIVKALKNIAMNENIAVSSDALNIIAENSHGDMRAAVRNLESLALGRKTITADDASVLSDRIVKKGMYDLMESVFRKGDAKEARRLMMDVDETPDHIMLWLDENLPHEFKDRGDLVRGYEKLSRADVFLGRVYRRQYYGFWSYAGDMMTSGVAVSKLSNIKNNERFRFPSYLMKMSRGKGVAAMKRTVSYKLAVFLHTSTGRASNDVLPFFRIMMINDPELRVMMCNSLDLDAEELAFLLNAKVDSKIVKDTLLAVQDGKGISVNGKTAKTRTSANITSGSAVSEMGTSRNGDADDDASDGNGTDGNGSKGISDALKENTVKEKPRSQKSLFEF